MTNRRRIRNGTLPIDFVIIAEDFPCFSCLGHGNDEIHRSLVSRREEVFTEIYFCSLFGGNRWIMNNCLFINDKSNDQSNQSSSKIC